MGRPLRIDADETSGSERRHAGLEGSHVLVHLVGIVLAAVHGDGADGLEEPGDDGVPEKRGCSQVVDLSIDDRPHEERVDQVVGMVDAEEHRAPARHPVRVPHVDRAEEEPDPEAAGPADERIERIGLIHHLLRYCLRVGANSSGRSRTLAPVKSTRVPRSAAWSAGSNFAETWRLRGPARTSSLSPRLSSAIRVTMT